MQAETPPERFCPCYSGKPYGECCKPFHTGFGPAPDALHLMRSRYSAYALGLIDYIIDTTHPNHPEKKKKRKEWRDELTTFSKTTTFTGLEILQFVPGKPFSTVTFIASLKQGQKDVSFKEKSLFEELNKIWYYLSGTAE